MAIESIRIKGNNVPGSLLVRAMQTAHVKAYGDQEAGVGIFRRYLKAPAAGHNWEQATRLPPETAVARACLSSFDLEKAGQAVESATELDQRKALLGQIAGPLVNSTQEEIEAEALANELTSCLPKEELTIGSYSGYTGSVDPVTRAQYEIFMAQTGRHAPFFWEKLISGRAQQPGQPVIGVSFDAAVAFNTWQGRKLPTEELLEVFGGQYPMFGTKVDRWQAAHEGTWFLEWTGTPAEQKGEAVVYSLAHSDRLIRTSDFAAGHGNVGFRAGRSTIKGDGDEQRGYSIWG
jgi:formylglycine-generating enzyme required for sulfatase activity